MNILKRAAIMAASAGLLATGGIAVSGAAANASTAVASCDAASSVALGAPLPACTSSGTVYDPTSLALTVSSAQLATLFILGSGLQDQWSVACDEGGGVTYKNSGTFTVSSAGAPTSTSLPTGGTVPTSCTVTAQVSQLAGLPLPLPGGELAETVTAGTAVPGVMWTGNGTTAATCADDTKNLNVTGNPVQAFTCLGDLADYWVQDSGGEFVHDGLCMTNNAGAVELDTCAQTTAQEWTQPESGGEVQLTSDPTMCLTNTSTTDGTQLQVLSCAGTADQDWTVPGPSPA